MMMMIPIEMTLVGILIDDNDKQASNAPSPIVVTVVGIVILVKVQNGYW